MNIEFLNCTPHDIFLVDDKKNVLRKFPKTSVDVRLQTKPQVELPFQTLGLPVVSKQTFTGIDWPMNRDLLIPDYVIPKGSWILVSMPVGEYLASHPDECEHWVFGPDTGPGGAVRDQQGQIYGTKRLVFYAAPKGTKHSCCVCAAYFPGPGYCPGCGTHIEDSFHIEGTHLFWRKGKVIRTPISVTLPPDEEAPKTTTEPDAKKFRLSQEKEADPEN